MDRARGATCSGPCGVKPERKSARAAEPARAWFAACSPGSPSQETVPMKRLLIATALAVGSGVVATDVQAQRYEQCRNCGEVVDINRYDTGEGRTSGGGAVAGALIGGLLGNQVGSGSGRKVATVAGAVAGGVAGNRIEKNRRGGGDRYEVVVQMDDGRR